MTKQTCSHGNDAPSRKSLLERMQTVVGIVLAVVTAFSVLQLNSAEKSLKTAELGLKDRESIRKDSEETRGNRESIEKKQLMVYDAVVKSLESGDPKRQRVSKALVISMLEDPLRTELLTVLTESSSPEIKKEVQVTLSQERKFKTDEGNPSPKQLTAPFAPLGTNQQKASSNWADWDIDIFWCERSGAAAENEAEKIKKQLLAEGAKGRLRVRLLPDSINARPGYQHAGYVIRYNVGEEAQSNRLKSLGDKAIGVSFLATLSRQPTPWYLSAFACPPRQ